MTEWRMIAGETHYEVSENGGVRSLDKAVRGPHGSMPVKRGQALRPYICKQTGYLQVTLSARRKHNLHRLVAVAFVPNPDGKPQVNHINGIRSDPRAANLEWVTSSENARHAFRELGRVNPFTGKTGRKHPTSRAVVATCAATGGERFYECALLAVREGFDSSCISRSAHSNGERLHKGHYWRFAEHGVATQEEAT
jgi:hypothetical protein